jgi:hypothetical protein
MNALSEMERKQQCQRFLTVSDDEAQESIGD